MMGVRIPKNLIVADRAPLEARRVRDVRTSKNISRPKNEKTIRPKKYKRKETKNMILVQFGEREVDITNLEKEIKEKIKEAKAKQKDVTGIRVYVKPEATYVIVETKNEPLEFKLFER